MGQSVVLDQLEQTLPPPPAAEEARGALPVLLAVGPGPHISHLEMAGDAVLPQPVAQGAVIVRIESGIDVQGHQLHGKGKPDAVQEHDLQQEKTVHSPGNGDADPGPGPQHPVAVHELSRLGQAGLLRVGQLFSSRHNSCIAISEWDRTGSRYWIVFPARTPKRSVFPEKEARKGRACY